MVYQPELSHGELCRCQKFIVELTLNTQMEQYCILIGRIGFLKFQISVEFAMLGVS